MKVLISGSSKGIGRSVALFFLEKGYEVYGLDLLEPSIHHDNYHHYIVDIKEKNSLPDIEGINYLFNNAGVQNSEDDISNNLKGTINVTNKYGLQKDIISILFNASASSRSGFEFPEYVASKAGIVGYMKYVASQISEYRATANSISLGGVITESNSIVMGDEESWKKIMKATPLKKWTSLEEVNEWVYFLLVKNKSMSGEDLLIDNGEFNLNNSFVWPEVLK